MAMTSLRNDSLVLWNECLCPCKTHMLKPIVMGLGGGTFGRYLDLNDVLKGVFIMGLVLILSSFSLCPLPCLPPPTHPPLFPPTGEHHKKASICKHRRGSTSEPDFAGTLMSDFPDFTTVRKNRVLFKPHSLWYLVIEV